MCPEVLPPYWQARRTQNLAPITRYTVAARFRMASRASEGLRFANCPLISTDVVEMTTFVNTYSAGAW
jgi:hypothetical protein